MVLMPVAFLGTIGFVAQTRVVPDDNPQFGPDSHQRLLAYSPLVGAAESLPAPVPDSMVGDLRRVTDLWTEAVQSESLGVVRRASLEVPFSETVLHQIKEAQEALMTACSARAQTLIAAGKADEAARWLVDGIVVGEANKTADLGTGRALSLRQSRLLRQLASISPRLDPATRSRALAGLSAVDGSSQGLECSIRHIRQIHVRTLAEQGERAQSIELTRGYELLAQLAREPSEARASAARDLASPDSPVGPQIVTSATLVRLAVSANQEFQQSLAAATRALRS